jgi:hypothetical protein
MRSPLVLGAFLVLLLVVQTGAVEVPSEIESEKKPVVESRDDVGAADPQNPTTTANGSPTKPRAIRYGTQNYRKVMNQLRQGKSIKSVNFNEENTAKVEKMFADARAKEGLDATAAKRRPYAKLNKQLEEKLEREEKTADPGAGDGNAETSADEVQSDL